MTTEHEASRTLVKSPPELWAECSDAGSLARHLGEFGEITITRLEPETTVAWEGEHASGTVRIEPSAWGTRVTLTAQTRAEDVAVDAPADGPPPTVEEAAPRAEQSLPENPSEPAEEKTHATLEETPEEPHPAPAGEAGAFRIRWRRMRDRMRGVFRDPAAGTVHQPEIPAEAAALSIDPPGAARPESEPAIERHTAPLPEAEAADPVADSELDPEPILVAALDSLGQAHHRPFSRA